MIIDIHMLQTHPASNPNRDDLGAPKRTVFGGVPRLRISSQCIKRSIRTSDLFKQALTGNVGIRTVTFPDLVQQALAESAIPEEERAAVVVACSSIAKKEKEKKGAEPDQEGAADDERARTEQLIFLGPTEAGEFVRVLSELREEMPGEYQKFLRATPEDEAGEEETAAKKPKKGKGAAKSEKPSKPFIERLRGVFQHDAADIALFGRMTTSDYFANVEAAMQVAHAISTDTAVPDTDYYTAVDDRQLKEQTGSAFLGEFQFGSATFYKYFSLNFDLLVKNLGGDADLARKTVAAFLEAAACTVPTGKRNSFANNNLPDAILVEVREKSIPVSYANAFLKPSGGKGGDEDVMTDSIRKLRAYGGAIAKGYGLEGARCWFSTRPVPAMKPGEDIQAETIETLAALQQAVLAALPEPSHV